MFGSLTYLRHYNSHVSLRGKLNGSEVLLELQAAECSKNETADEQLPLDPRDATFL
jgi:hypothetical protein